MSVTYLTKEECKKKLEERLNELIKVIYKFIERYDNDFKIFWEMRPEEYYKKMLTTLFTRASYRQLCKMLKIYTRNALRYVIITTCKEAECFEDKDTGKIYVYLKGYKI